MKEPKPIIAIGELGDSSVNFKVMVWCNSVNYWSVFFETQEKVKLTFDKEGISIPFPQRDIHVYNEK
jgi:small conductance mechanosensitive channel